MANRATPAADGGNRLSAALELVERLYATVLDEAAWPELTVDMVALVGGAGSLMVVDRERGITAGHSSGITESAQASYFGEFVDRDEILKLLYDVSVGRSVTLEMLMSPREFSRIRVYNEWYLPNRFVQLLGAICIASPSHVGGLGVFRGARDPAFTEEDLYIAGQLARHVGRVHRLRHQLLTATAAGDMARLLVDRRRRVVFADEAAEAILRRGDPLLVRHERLACRDPKLDRRLGGYLANFAADPRGSEPVVLGVPGDGWRRAQLRLTPFPSSAAWPFSLGGEVLLSIEPERSLSRPEDVRIRFELTHMEARVALAVADSRGLGVAAERLGLSRNTVHTHLQRVFDKTGVHRQADLVRLLTR